MSGPRYSIIPGDAVLDPELKDGHLRVLAVVGTHTNNQGWCKVNQGTTATKLGVTRGYVNKAIKSLCELGYLEKTDQFTKSDGGRTLSLYRVVMDRDPMGSGEHIPLSSGEHNLTTTSEPKGSSVTPRSVLETVLSEQLADALLEHRQALRARLTVGAAQQLVKQFVLSGEPQNAAELMLAMGWRGFRASWMERANNVAQRANGQSGSIHDAARELQEQANDDEQTEFTLTP